MKEKDIRRLKKKIRQIEHLEGARRTLTQERDDLVTRFKSKIYPNSREKVILNPFTCNTLMGRIKL